jgi:hypothetical protein
MTTVPPWVFTLFGAITAAVGYLSDPTNLAVLPAGWARTIATIGVVVGVIGHILAQYQSHQAIAASAPAASTNAAATATKSS